MPQELDKLNNILDTIDIELQEIFEKIRDRLDFNEDDLADVFSVFQRENSREQIENRYVLLYCSAQSHEIPEELLPIKWQGKFLVDKKGNWYFVDFDDEYKELREKRLIGWIVNKMRPETQLLELNKNKLGFEILEIFSSLVKDEIDRRMVYIQSLDGYKDEKQIEEEKQERVSEVIEEE